MGRRLPQGRRFSVPGANAIVADMYGLTSGRVALFRPALAFVIAAGLTTMVVSAQGPTAIRATNPFGLLVPDSELVFGPTLYGWSTKDFIDDRGGYASSYTEVVDQQVLTAAQILDRIAGEYGVGQRVLLALLEMYGGWVSSREPQEISYPVGEPVPGLEAGLSRAASGLVGGFYGHRNEGLATFTLADGQIVELSGVNAGTFAVVAQVSSRATSATWAGLEGPSRFYMAWNRLFGDAALYHATELLPEELPELELHLPFEPGQVWFYTSGPYGPAGPGSPPSAIDFSPPPAELEGCHLSVEWVTAAAGGVVVRATGSELVVDTDGDGFEGSGWTHHYRHLADFQRVAEGTEVDAGDRLGHPSCDDGAETVTRVGFSRRYNGVWIEADYPGAPLVMAGWAALPGPEPRAGWLIRSGLEPREASQTKTPSVNGVIALAGD